MKESLLAERMMKIVRSDPLHSYLIADILLVLYEENVRLEKEGSNQCKKN